eukprot:Anaeramoba_flamelloidesc23647_g1_i1.p1 GENE.c23647_g1_i1~~c23647_g1_i1.p1  ORF type:complete len:285 (+),score=16.35 c23647_g1_i1:810-1664(+)
MVVNTNNSALITNEHLTNGSKRLNSSLEKMASGLKINKASDNASGLTIADQLRTQATSLNQSVENGNIAVTFLQIADRAMAEQSNILDSIKAKLIQAMTSTTSKDGRTAIIKDINRLLHQLDNIASQTNYNGTHLLQKTDGDNGAVDELIFQMGEISGNTINIEADDIQANTEGLNLDTLKEYKDGDDLTKDSAAEHLRIIDSALDRLNKYRADYGSTQNQIESSTRNMMTGATNLKDSESIIRDVDYSEESARFTNNNLIALTGGYAMSQANSAPKNVLYLLR